MVVILLAQPIEAPPNQLGGFIGNHGLRQSQKSIEAERKTRSDCVPSSLEHRSEKQNAQVRLNRKSERIPRSLLRG